MSTGGSRERTRFGSALRVPLPILLILPATVVLGALFLAPLGRMALYAVLTPGPRGEPMLPFTFENLIGALDPLYLTILIRSLRLALLTTLGCLIVGFPVAWALTGLGKTARTLALLALVLPSWSNLLVKNYAWIVLLRREGVVNGFLLRVGWVEEPLSLLFHEGAVWIGLVHTFLPFMVLPLFAALDKLDPKWIEAARDLGAGRWAQFRWVLLPAARPGIAAGGVLVFIPALGAFVTPDLLGGTRAMMVGNLIQNQMLVTRDWPFGSALSLWLMSLCLLAMVGLSRLRGEAGEEGRL